MAGAAGFDRDLQESSKAIQFNALDVTTENRAIDLRSVRFSPDGSTLEVSDFEGWRSLRFHNAAGDLSPKDIHGGYGVRMALDLQASGAILGRAGGAFAVGSGVSRLSLSAAAVGSAAQPVNVQWGSGDGLPLAVTAGAGGAHVDIYRQGTPDGSAPLDLSLTVANADARIRWGGESLSGPLGGSLGFVAQTARLEQTGGADTSLVPGALAFRNSAGSVLPGALQAREQITLTASGDIRADSQSLLRLSGYPSFDRTARIDLNAGGSIGRWEPTADVEVFTPLGVRFTAGGVLAVRAGGTSVAIRGGDSHEGPGSVALAVGQTDARIDLDSGGVESIQYRGQTGGGRLDARATGLAALRFDQTTASDGHVEGGNINVGGSLRIETASGYIANADGASLMRADGGLVLRAPAGRIGSAGGSDPLRTRAQTLDVGASGSIRLSNDGFPSALTVTTAGQDVDVRRSLPGGADSRLLEFSRSNSVLDIDAPYLQSYQAITFVNTDAATGVATRDVNAGTGMLQIETAGHLRNHSAGEPLINAGHLTLRADQGIGGPNPSGNPAGRPLAIRLDNGSGSGSGVLTLDNRSSTAGAYVINETGLANPLLDLTTHGGDLRVEWVADSAPRRVDYRAADAGAFTLDAGAQPVRFTQAAGDLSVQSVFNAGTDVPLTLRATGHILMASGAEDPVTVTGALSLHAGGDIGQAQSAFRAQAPGVWSLAGRSVHADNLAAPAAVLVGTSGGEAHVTWAGLGGTTTNQLQAALSQDRSTTRVSVARVGGEGSSPPADYANRALVVTNRAGHVEIGDIQAPGVRLALAAHGDIRDSVVDLSSLAVGSGGSVSLASATGSIDVRSISGDPLHTAVRVNIPNASDRSARVDWTDNSNTSRIGYVGSGLLSIEAPTSGSAISFVNGPLSVASPSTAAWRSAIFGDHDLQVGMVNAPLSAVTLATSGTIRQPNPGAPARAGALRRFALNGIYGGSADADGAGIPFSAVTDQVSAYNLRANGARAAVPEFFLLYRTDGIRLRASPTVDGGDVTVLRRDGLFGAAEPGGAFSDAQRAQAGLSQHDAFGAGIRNAAPRGDVRLTVERAGGEAEGLRVGYQDVSGGIHSSNGDVVLTADRIDLQATVRNREGVQDSDTDIAPRRVQFRPVTVGRALEVCASECTLSPTASLRLDPEQLSSRVDATWIVLGDSEALSGAGQAIVPSILRISEALDLNAQGSGLILSGGDIAQRSILRDGPDATEAPILVGTLRVVGATVDLRAANRVEYVSGRAQQAFRINNAVDLGVGYGFYAPGGYLDGLSVNGTAASEPVVLDVSTTGSLGLGPLNARNTDASENSTGSRIRLRASGDITQFTGNNGVEADRLEVVSTGGQVNLTDRAGNRFGTVAGSSAGRFILEAATGFEIGSVDSLVGGTTAGVTATGQAITLASSQSGASIRQTATAPLVADSLVIVRGGSVGANVDLQAEGNRIGRLSGEAASLDLRNAQALEIGTGGGYSGLAVVDPYQIKATGGHLTVASGATLSGSGSIELDAGKRVDNLGTVQLRPLAASGNAGTLSINRDFVNASGGTLALSIGGATAGSGAGGYDQLQVGGSATLGGTLTATLANGFTPSGQSFDLVRADTATGTFATRNLPAGLEEGLLRTGSPQASVFRLLHTGESCPSGVICWDGGAGTTRWTDAANWRGDALPGSGDRVALRLPGTTAKHDQGSVTSTVESIDTRAGTQLDVSAGTLTVRGTTHASTLAGGLAVQGGTLNVNGAMNAASVAQSGGTLSVGGAGTLTTDALSLSAGTLSVAGTLSATGLAQSAGTLQLSGSSARASTGAFAQSGGTVNGAGDFTVNGSFSQSSGGSIDTTGTVAVTQSSGNLVVGGGVSGRSVSLTAGAGSVRIDAPVASTTGTLAIEAAGASSDVQVQAGVSSASGLIDIDAGRDILIDQAVSSSSGMVALAAGRDVRVRADVTTAGALVAFAGGELRIEDARVQAGETAIVLADAVSVVASESSAGLGAGGDLGVAANGALLVRGGAAEGASASIYSGSGDFILSARGITLAGGAGRYASAVLSGNPDVDLTLTAGSSLALVPGTGEFASARVEASLPTTILLDLRGNPVGGFSVAGVANSIFHEPSGSGLFANGGLAVRGDSLKVFYNGIPEGQGSTQPPIDPASLVLAALDQGRLGGATQGQTAAGTGDTAASSDGAQTSTEEGTTILLLRPRPPAQCN